MSVGGVSGSSLIPALLFILPMTLIPSVSDPETLLIPWWHCARGPSCRLSCCAASRPANLWSCLGCYWCHPAPSSPITFFTLFLFPHCFLSLSHFLTLPSLSCSLTLLADDETPTWHQLNTFVPFCCIKNQCPFPQCPHITNLPWSPSAHPPKTEWTCSGGGGDKCSTEGNSD